MPKLTREQIIALAVLAGAVLIAVLAPAYCLALRSEAAHELEDERFTLARLEAAHQRAGKGSPGAADRVTAAPAAAFLDAQTAGLASAQLEAYLAQLVAEQQGSLVSSSVQKEAKSDGPDVVRVQANVEISYEALQKLLYKLETGTPYVFIEAMTVQAPSAATHASAMRVTFNLRAIWRRRSA